MTWTNKLKKVVGLYTDPAWFAAAKAGDVAVIEAFLKSGVRVIGMTVMPGPQLEQAVPLTRRIRDSHPAVRIVWGGYFPTMYPELVLESGLVDSVVWGHGDRNLLELFVSLVSESEVPDLPGVGRVGPDGRPIVSPPPAVPDLDWLDDFPYHRIRVERYARSTFMGRRTLSHHSSYGCPFRCNFCAVVNMVDGAYSAQNAGRVARVSRRLVSEFGADSVEYYDNNFFVDEGRSREVADRIAELDLGWWVYGRIDTMLGFANFTWGALARSGLRMVFLGAESGSDETLKRMNKGGR